jgi:hypothetical protein
MVFTVSEKLVMARDGASYDIGKYIEGIDYVQRRAFKGVRKMFRKGILGPLSEQEPDHVGKSTDMVVLTVVDPSLVEHKQNMPPIVVQRPQEIDDAVRTARVVKKHANQRWVDTDTLGRVFVGEKGNQIRLQQLIAVRNGSLYLGNLS